MEKRMDIVIKEKAQKMLQEKLTDGKYLRLLVVEGGCAGMTYSAEISADIKDDEEIILEEEGVRLIAAKKECQYIDGLTIDYSDDLVGAGLQFANRKSKGTCGCGASFSLSGFPVQGDGNCCS